MVNPKGVRRTVSPAAGLNPQIVGALLILLALYTFVTFGALWRVPSLEDEHAFFHGGVTGRFNPRAEAIPRRSVNLRENDQLESEKPVQTAETVNTVETIDQVRYRFPVHVGDNVEEIEHPGIAYALQKPAGLPTTMKVPKFWDSEAYGPGGVRHYLGDGERLPTPDEAANVGSWVGDLETIYASVASYRDPECAPTIESIFARAKYPERIRVAVIEQKASVDPDYCQPETPCAESPNQPYCLFQKNIDIFTVDARLSVGPVFARHLAHRMFRGEYFAMQVDSHVRFVQDWDEDLVQQWKSAKNEMGVLTTYLSDIIGSIDPNTHKSTHFGRPIMCKSDYEGNGKLKHLRHGQQPEGPAGIKGEPTLHPFWAAGFSFARAHFVAQIPYDQYLPMVFQGEEISMGLRGFTYGYDYYTAERSVCFHMYAIKENTEKRHKVKLFWENGPTYRGAELKAMKRLNGIIGMGDPNDEYDHADETKYGLGKIRKPDKFFETFGIHRETQRVEQNLCIFVGKPMMREFKPHLRKNRMGINYDEIEYKFVDPKQAQPVQQVALAKPAIPNH